MSRLLARKSSEVTFPPTFKNSCKKVHFIPLHLNVSSLSKYMVIGGCQGTNITVEMKNWNG